RRGRDALEQDQQLMLLLECADLLGALSGVFEQRPDPLDAAALYRMAAELGITGGGVTGSSPDRHRAALADALDELSDLVDGLERPAPDGHDQPFYGLQIAANVGRIAFGYGLSFDAVNRFAELRRTVARGGSFHAAEPPRGVYGEPSKILEET